MTTELSNTPEVPITAEAPLRDCENCGTPLHGPYCGNCGQPTKGMVRHFSTIVGDFLDTVFNFDSRIIRTLYPLLLKPGHLTREYFLGHRVRYVTPVRLFFVLCIAAFLMVRFSIDMDDNIDLPDTIERAESIEEVERRRDAAIGGLELARNAMLQASEPVDELDAGVEQVRAIAQRRIDWLTAREEAKEAGKAFDTPYPGSKAASDGDNAPPDFRFNDHPWHPRYNPVAITWLPAVANNAINRMLGRAQTNIVELRNDRSRLIEAFLQTLPQSLLVLVPIFALVLKLSYLFTPRLYMEHLLVVLHSHAFLCLVLLLVPGITMLRDLFTSGGFIDGVLRWVSIGLMAWVPIYLLLMQKRVYAQSWLLTLFKFFVLGNIHLILVSIGLAISLAISLVVM